MILIDLLIMLSIGVVFSVVANHVEIGRQNVVSGGQEHLHHRSRNKVESELDGLLILYNQGLLSEKQYGDQSDALIDQLADILHEEAT
ncbi:MAG: hypothetical protein BGO21_22120 [Dyadobacter sp. 50-39]|jgi:hypothetical protein|uniref:hypothetical protein n=1 Tax=Dyadobacter sp. 50-39 TaxID=1895756 RepID=UPI00095F9809|nr:hypothetical protein [Dyadobacter sp. 50-39]OJV19760.1 MAG: hypothetical protein BGO21_22120 [Dyadobacter sp. 50-39]